jgi:hypothetical protein
MKNQAKMMIVAIGTLTAGLVLAMPPTPPAFTDLDLDGDGQITQQEFTQFRATRMAGRAAQGYPLRNAGRAAPFAQIDADGDGTLSRQEFDSYHACRPMMGNRSGPGPRSGCRR